MVNSDIRMNHPLCEVYLQLSSTFDSFLYNTHRYLFLDHVKTIGLHVANAGKIPIMWDDMLINMPHTDIKEWFYKINSSFNIQECANMK